MSDIFDDVVDESKEESPLVVGGMDNVEMVQFYKFVMGQAVEPPEAISKMMNNLITKLSMGLGYNVVNNIGRQADLSKFLSEAEKKLFNKESIEAMTTKELQDSYKAANTTLNNLQEFQRKFIVQNRETLKTDNSPQEKLMNKIMTLPPDKMKKIMETLDKMETDDKVPLEEVSEE